MSIRTITLELWVSASCPGTVTAASDRSVIEVHRMEIIRQDHQSMTISPDSTRHVKVRITMPCGQQPTEIRVALRRSRQQDGTMPVVDEFRANDRAQAGFTGELEKSDDAVEAVGISQREGRRLLLLGRQAESRERRNPRHRGIGGVDVQLHERGRHAAFLLDQPQYRMTPVTRPSIRQS